MVNHAPEEQRLLTLEAMQAARLSVRQVWVSCFSLTGNTDEFEVDAYLHGLIHLTPQDRDFIALAVNELIDDMQSPTAPYSWD